MKFEPAHFLMSIRARLILLLPFLLAALLVSCDSETAAQDEARGLVILGGKDPSRPNFHDFGEVVHGRVVTHTFKLLNTDPVPVTIRDLIPSCGCTVPVIHYIDLAGVRVEGHARARGEVLTVPPGATVYVTMKTDTTEVGIPNRDKLSLVRLRCDSINTAFMTFELHLIVRLLFQATPFDIKIGQVARSTGGSSFSEIISAIPKSGARILEVESSDPILDVTLTESVRFGTTLWTLSARLPADQPLGPNRSEIILKTTDIDGKGDAGRFKVGVTAQVVPDIIATPPTASLGSFLRSEGRTIDSRVRTLVPGHRLLLTGHELTGEGTDELQVTLSPISPDDGGRAQEWNVSLTIPAGASLDLYAGTIILKLDDPQYPTLRLPFSGQVLAN